MIPFQTLSLPLLAAIFVLAAAAVWMAGVRLTRFVDSIASLTGLGKAFTGMLLLGGITSLPEVAAVSTSAAMGNAPLALNNLLGTAAINLLVLALADIVYGRDALTSVAAAPATLMQGVLSMVLASGVAWLAVLGDLPLFGAGVGSTALIVAAAGALWLSSDFERRHVWEVVGGSSDDGGAGEGKAEREGYEGWPLGRLIAATVVAGLVILVAGFFLSSTADAIATRTGIAAGMVGFVLVGLSTSLPEISTITTAVRMRRYQMAVGDIFGTNLFNLGLIFLADAIYPGDPLLSEAGVFEVTSAILALLLTGVFIVGLLERRDRTILRMGYDSLAAILIFAGGVVALARIGG